MILFAFFAMNSSGIIGAELPVNLDAIAALFHFPASEVELTDTTVEEKKITAGGVLAACVIRGKTPYSFFPLRIALVKEGVFRTAEWKSKLSRIDSLPPIPVSSGGKGPLGSFTTPNGYSGALDLGDIEVPYPPWTQPVLESAMFTLIVIPKLHAELRIAWSNEFSPEKLVKVRGGEAYYEEWTKELDRDGADPTKLRPEEVSLREEFISLSQIVIESRIVAAARGAVSSPAMDESPTEKFRAPSADTSDASSPRTQVHPAATYKKMTVWVWVSGIVALLIIARIVAKRRS